MTREHRYAELVAQRKAYDPTPLELHNPASVEGGQYDSAHIGPWTVWAHDLHADLMVVGQDWGDVGYFTTNKGVDKAGNPTNKALRQLLESVGRPVSEPPARLDAGDSSAASSRVWLTNALLWLKTGGMSAPVKGDWFNDHSAGLLRAQIDLVEPRVVVALGSRAYDCIVDAYGAARRTGPFRRVVEDANGVELDTQSGSSRLFGVYHCGARIQNTLRSMEQQLRDWERVRRVLDGE